MWLIFSILEFDSSNSGLLAIFQLMTQHESEVCKLLSVSFLENKKNVPTFRFKTFAAYHKTCKVLDQLFRLHFAFMQKSRRSSVVKCHKVK